MTCHECGREVWCYSCATKGGPGAHLIPDSQPEGLESDAPADPAHNTENKETR